MNKEEIFAAVQVGKSRGSNHKYALSGERVEIKIPSQARDVLIALDEIPASVEEIANRAEIKTKQTKARIVQYYLPLLIKNGLVIKS